MNVDNIVSDIEKSNSIMREVLGESFSTRVIRFPGGYWSWEGRTAMKEAMDQNGYYNVDWNALNKDAEGKQKNADELLQSTKETVEALGPDADSVVLLMHDTYGKEETVKALPQIIEYLQEKGNGRLKRIYLYLDKNGNVTDITNEIGLHLNLIVMDEVEEEDCIEVWLGGGFNEY